MVRRTALLPAVLILALGATAAGFAQAQTNPGTTWFQADPKAAAYRSVQAEVEAVIEEATSAGVPADLLVDKLREGASKRVPPGVLVSAVRAEADRLHVAADMLARETQDRTIDEAIRERELKSMSLLLLAGASSASVEAVAASAAAAGRSGADASEAFAVLLQARLSVNVGDKAIAALGSALLQSKLPRAAFASVPGILQDASARGLDIASAAASLVSILQAGGGTVEMQQEIRKEGDLRASRQAGAGGRSAGQGRDSGRAAPGAGTSPPGGQGKPPGAGGTEPTGGGPDKPAEDTAPGGSRVPGGS